MPPGARTRRYTELEEAALRRQVKEKTTPAAIQKRRKEMQSENMSKVGGEKHNISAMSEEDVKQRIEKEVRRARVTGCTPGCVRAKPMPSGRARALNAARAGARAEEPSAVPHRAQGSPRSLFFLSTLGEGGVFVSSATHPQVDDQDKLMMRHQELTDTNEDQLSLAAIHYLRSHFQEVRARARLTSACAAFALLTPFAPRPPARRLIYTRGCSSKAAMILHSMFMWRCAITSSTITTFLSRSLRCTCRCTRPS